MAEVIDCQVPCDEDCEVGPYHCWNWHRPSFSPERRQWHDPEFCDNTQTIMRKYAGALAVLKEL